MKKTWNENSARNYLSYVADLKFEGKNIIAHGLSGLTACSAVDYLKKYCGYKLFLQLKG